MIEAFATVEDFEDRHGALPDDEVVKVASRLEDATDLVMEAAEAADPIPDWTADSVPHRVKRIVLDVAYRAWSNPDALAQASMGDVALTYTRGGTPDAVFLTKAEAATIVKSAGSSSFASATLVSPYSGDDRHPMDFYPDGM